VAVRVLQLTNNENVQMHELSDLVSSDPVFAGEVLTLANSVLYAPRYPSSSIFQAIVVLGATTLQGMCITVGARAYLGRSMSQPAMRGLWRHNLACAIIARQLASAGFRDGDTAYTSGIMHDLGRMALAAIQPKAYAHLLGTHCGTPESILEQERQLFGWDHCETGQRLIADWNLPSEFDVIVAGHHNATEKAGSWDMAELLKISCRMADVIGFPAFPGCEATAYEELREEMPAREQGLFTVSQEELAAEVANSIQELDRG
jgi:HD-like signal output (HDOD) protein